jgi:small-conductance mechanosensitive channel
MNPAPNANQLPVADNRALTKAETRDKVWFGSCTFALVLLGTFYFLINRKFFRLSPETAAQLVLYIKAGVFIALVLALSRAIRVYLFGRVQDIISQYTLNRILRLIVVSLIIFIIVTALFANLLTTIVSLGVVTIIIGFALQTVLLSFIGWIYILVRNPYRVGDRVKIGEAEGDVIDVSYLDTTLWEFGTSSPSSEPPGGKTIKFPNSRVLNMAVFNYSRPLLPYVWNEMVFKVGSDSDLEVVSKIIREAVAEELGEEVQARILASREMLAQTAHPPNVQESPGIAYRTTDPAWTEVIVRYLGDPKKAGHSSSHLLKQVMAKLRAAPGSVMLPQGDAH